MKPGEFLILAVILSKAAIDLLSGEINAWKFFYVHCRSLPLGAGLLTAKLSNVVTVVLSVSVCLNKGSPSGKV